MIAICGKAKYDRAKDGPRDRILTGWLFQASNEPLAVTQSSGDVRYIRDARDNPILAARCRFGIFRPFKTALPSVNPGDVLVLREFRMETIGEEPYLRSKDSSSWAVVSFPVYAYSAAALKHASPEDDAALAAQAEVAVSGPPIEYSDEELVHAMRLKRWYEHFGKLVPIVDT
ncbi:hypothetical protein BCR37DRAFT_381813 [Protomyces lactucae-debilis]|uniref:Uncharacterized protein n=1 Tax=Protomyces lactucae-debilis TaxID=2754530 RepID=A0A1Y2F5K8_PROLT|nr:uncharacterized protein BCR37DRAFT_381813 [Protomyces lactucae-debilis]ORY78947.1 hypothetical protein BCR37DRAFT_381813 [Protomyces lactucae-debilis]